MKGTEGAVGISPRKAPLTNAFFGAIGQALFLSASQYKNMHLGINRERGYLC